MCRVFLLFIRSLNWLINHNQLLIQRCGNQYHPTISRLHIAHVMTPKYGKSDYLSRMYVGIYCACMWVSTAHVCRYLLRGWGTGKNRNMPLSPARITDHRKLPQVGKPNFWKSDNFIMDFMLNRIFWPCGKTWPKNRQKTAKGGKSEFLGVIMRMRVFLVWKTWAACICFWGVIMCVIAILKCTR